MASKKSSASHAMLPQSAIQIGDAPGVQGLLNNLNPANAVDPSGKDWTPTLINPDESGSMRARVLGISHVLLWVTCCGLVGASGYGMVGMSPSWVSPSTQLVAIFGATSTVLGVVAIVLSSMLQSASDYTEFKTGGVLTNVAVQFFTLMGTVCTVFIFAHAGSDTTSGYFMLVLISTIFVVYAQTLLFHCTQALDTLALPRTFLPCLAIAVQTVSAIAINGGDFHPTASNLQKVLVWVLPGFNLIALILMVIARAWAKDDKIDINMPMKRDLTEWPFLRSLITTPFLLASLLAFYKLSFVKADVVPTSYLFAIVGAFVQFGIVIVVYADGSVKQP